MIDKFIYKIANNYNWKNIVSAIFLLISTYAFLRTSWEFGKQILESGGVTYQIGIGQLVSMLFMCYYLDYFEKEIEKVNKKHQKQIRN